MTRSGRGLFFVSTVKSEARAHAMILYRDDDVVVVNKASGLLVHRTHLAPDVDVLMQRVRRAVGKPVYTVHRLDRQTSGIVLFGLSSAAARDLQAVLTAPETLKRYVGLVRGDPGEARVFDRGLSKLSSDDRVTKRHARTELRRLEVYAHQCLCALRPLTGRSHQIRRHLQHEALHLVGDTRYGKGGINRLFRAKYDLYRMFLHAERLEIAHPATGERLCVTCPLPPELTRVLDQLRRETAAANGSA